MRYVVDIDGNVVKRYQKILGRYYDVKGDYSGTQDAFAKFMDFYMAA